MSRWIDADALWEYANNQKNKSVDANDFMRFPYIDIVRCKDCIFADGKPIADGRYWCNIHRCYMRFCSDGERKESE